MFVPHILLCKTIRNLGTQQDGRGTGCTCTWIYSAIYLIYLDITEFILQQNFNEFIGGKLDLSQKIKIKVFIVFDWKEDTNIEENGKVILYLLSVIYDFEEKKKTFLSSFFHALKILSIRITKLKNNDILFFRLSPVHLEFPWNFIIPKQIASNLKY